MAYKKNNPGCNASGRCGCGGPTCAICSPCALSNTLAGSDPSLSGGVYTISDASTFVVLGTPAPTGTVEVRFVISFKLGSGDNSFDIVFKKTAGDSYFYARISSDGTIRLFQKASGTDTELTFSFNPFVYGLEAGTWYTAKLCYGDGSVGLRIKPYGEDDFTGAYWATDITTADDTESQAGIKGVAFEDSVDFKEAELDYGYNDPDHLDCESCDPGHMCASGDCISGIVTRPSLDVTLPSNVFASAIEAVTPSFQHDTYRKPLRCDFTPINGQTYTMGPNNTISGPMGSGCNPASGGTDDFALPHPTTCAQGFTFSRWQMSLAVDFCNDRTDGGVYSPVVDKPCGTALYASGTAFNIGVYLTIYCESRDDLSGFKDANWYKMGGFPRNGTADTWPSAGFPYGRYDGLPLIPDGQNACMAVLTLGVFNTATKCMGIVEWSVRSWAPFDTTDLNLTMPFSRVACRGDYSYSHAQQVATYHNPPTTPNPTPAFSTTNMASQRLRNQQMLHRYSSLREL